MPHNDVTDVDSCEESKFKKKLSTSQLLHTDLNTFFLLRLPKI
jgi:hypothetical protein